jgi:hypothetical protein
MHLLLIEIVEFKGVHGKLMLREIAPEILPIFQKLVKSAGRCAQKTLPC